jgi:uncharacterized membrane protein
MTEPKTSQLTKGRMEALSDGVFAIAMTLLAFQLANPVLTAAKSEDELLLALGFLWPVFVSYAISFLALGLYWCSHHALASFLEKMDTRQLWFNLAFLFCISLIPFSASMLGEKFGLRSAAIIYGGNLSAASLIIFLSWRGAVDHRHLMPPGFDPAIRAYIYKLHLGMTVIYLGAAAAAFWNPMVSFWAYVLIALVHLGLQLLNPITERPSRVSSSIHR